MNNKDNIFKKWMPIFKSIGIQNQTLLEIFCLYGEQYSISNPNGLDLPEKINDLIWKLKSANKLKVVCSRYNPLTGKLEHELENGLVVDEDNKFEKELSQEELVSVFGVDFIREINKTEFRENRLKSIIDG
jgi:hypothetical protein